MIQLLADKYNRHIAFVFVLTLTLGLVPVRGSAHSIGRRFYSNATVSPTRLALKKNLPGLYEFGPHNKRFVAPSKPRMGLKQASPQHVLDNGGPSQPEMSSFQPAGTNNMVNLFTGDFSYNIPLLDVGGYPVNIFYDGNLSMEQDASWVGLGWNINPGNINRNMRGVPDDFNGTDELVQTQTMKPNRTWGINLNGDIEWNGLKLFESGGIMGGLMASLGVNLGFSMNNYLGPAMELGMKGGVGIEISKKTKAESSADTSIKVSLKAGLGINSNSRYGLTMTPNVSLTTAHFEKNKGVSMGLGLSTSYNSRYGIKSLQINDQIGLSTKTMKSKLNKSTGWTHVKWLSSSRSASLFGTSISFTRPSYIPAMRMPLTNTAWSGHFQLGGGLWGGYASGEVEVYGQVSQVAPEDVVQKKKMVGYLYYQEAENNPNAVMDFTRLNDNEVTSNTPIISAPQYSYDVFSIQGEGTGGTFRAYRNDYGYVRDNLTTSKDKNISAGADIGIPGHFGANFNTIKTPSVIGEWNENNNIKSSIGFKRTGSLTDLVYFRNPGEISVLHNQQFDKIGGIDLVRFRLGGTNASPAVLPVLEKFSPDHKFLQAFNMNTKIDPTERKKRSQVISFLTAADAKQVGLETDIRNYNSSELLDNDKNLKFASIDRVSDYRKPHHLSQISVLETDGKRYVYGIPVYNKIQKDFTFSVSTQSVEDQVAFAASEATSLSTADGIDGYLQIAETPAYAHSFLLTGLLSPDYVDVTGNGITEDDLGNAVKFNYTMLPDLHKWRTPLTKTAMANNNPGNLTEKKDNKGLVSYGERESWYLHSLESKTMIAVFVLGNRSDGKGSYDELKEVNTGDASTKKLERIDLYNKADLKKNGKDNARPIKSVHFQYSYRLCPNAPGNDESTGEVIDDYAVNTNKGKLTLEKIYFTYNKQTRVNKNQYVFSYGSTDPGTNNPDNPHYQFNASDRWGSYKPREANPGGPGTEMKNSEFPYTVQPKPEDIQQAHQRAGAWALKKILLPSGGQLEVEYESDDYAFVQDRRAADMMEIAGFGKEGIEGMGNKLYEVKWPQGPVDDHTLASYTDYDRVYIKVPIACTSRDEVFERYLRGKLPKETNQLAFKLAVNMPKGMEYVTSYAEVEDYGFVANSSLIWVKVKAIELVSPLSLTAVEYLREQLPGQAFTPAYDLSETPTLAALGSMLTAVFSSFSNGCMDPFNKLRSQGKAQTVVLDRSFVRLNDPDGKKFGGGNRVKKVVMKDNWQNMATQFTSTYGQEYDYTTTEVFNGQVRTISSGVASYEPTIGGEENPFQTIVQVANKLPMGPTSWGAIEMPVLDGFFPAPVVGYSKVTVKATVKNPSKKSRSGIGKQVTEYYTAKDFPVTYNHTPLDPSSDKQANANSLSVYFYKTAFDSRALSQGFIVATNDMHGKLKSQSSYAEHDPDTRINYTQYFYRNTGAKGLDEKFDFVSYEAGGQIIQGNMGIDVELMTDTRQFTVKSTSYEIQAQLDLYPIFGLGPWLPFVWPVFGNSENTYRAVTTTKVISYHSIVDSVVVIDKGSQVSTKNLVYDAETGSLVVSRTNNEFNRLVYNVNYPAWWAYSGMGPAYKNIDAVYSNVDFLDGKVQDGVSEQVLKSMYESGDELLMLNPGEASSYNCGPEMESGTGPLIWALDKTKHSSSLTNRQPAFVFMDKTGKLMTRDNVSFRVVRSGKRNMLDALASAVTLYTNPVDPVTNKLIINANSKVVNATAVEYKEKWHTDNEQIRKLKLVFNETNCTYSEVDDCNGYLEKNINPYRKGMLGTFRSHRSKVFYGSRTGDPVANDATNLEQSGLLQSFKLYWDFSGNDFLPDLANPKWVWNEEATRFNAKGMELETKNALNIYTGAQYGYSKTLPVAVTNNSRFYETAFEGFEDYGYADGVNKDNYTNPCATRFVDFNGIANSRIVNTDDSSFSAHTGKYALEVDHNSTATKVVPIIENEVSDNYDILFTTKTAKVLSNPGSNTAIGSTIPWWMNPSVTASATGGEMNFYPRVMNNNQLTYQYSYNGSFDFYINLTESKVYNFQIILDAEVRNNDNVTVYNNGMNITITGIDHPSVIKNIGLMIPKNVFYDAITENIYLCKGIYRIQGTGYQYYQNFQDPTDSYNRYRWSCGNCSPNYYKTLDTQNGCVSTLPLASTTSMINPGFNIQAGKKMYFSAWVKEKCGDPASGTPCNKSTYEDNWVNLKFSNNTSITAPFKAKGPIIDGWQRIEGEFTAPAGVTNVSVEFVNNSSDLVYYDDIRIHPYLANMKSFVYDPVNLRLVAELDANNYAKFYEYDAEGGLIRTKAETREGIKTIQETRSFKQKSITTIQQ